MSYLLLLKIIKIFNVGQNIAQYTNKYQLQKFKI